MGFRFLIVFLSLLIITATKGQMNGSLQEKRTITLDDFFSIKRLSDPQVSPDGAWIAYVVTEIDKSANSSNSDLWLVSIDGGNPQRLTDHSASDTYPRWSPDGRILAFASTRTGLSQVHLLDLTTREIRQLTTLSTGASGAIWSPDGRQIAFTSEVFPELEGDSANSARLQELDESLVQAHSSERLLFRHWNEWTDRTRSHVFVQSISDSVARDITPGDYDTPPISLGGAQDYTFSTNGSQICYVKNIDPVVALSTNNDLFSVNLSTDLTTQLTTNPANDNCPQYSPDGRFLAYRAQLRAGFESDQYRIMILEMETGAVIDLTGHYDRSVREYLWAPGGDGLYFTADDEGYRTIYHADTIAGEVSRLTQGTFNTGLQITPNGHELIFLRQSATEPPEIYKLDLDNGIETQLTHINQDLLAELDMNPAEEFWFTGARRTQVHGFIVKPPHFDPTQKYPLFLQVHGGPQGAWGDYFRFFVNHQLFASPGYVVVMINPRGSTGYGQQFTDEVTGDWGGKVYTDLMKGLDYVLENYDYIDQEQLVAMGGSYGGYMMNWFEGHTDRFKALVCHAGVFNLTSMYLHTEELWFPEWEFDGTPWTNPRQYRKWSPHEFIDKFSTPMLVTHGEQDFRVPVSEGLQTFTALQRMGVPSRLLYFPDEGHWILKPQNLELFYETIWDWLAIYLD